MEKHAQLKTSLSPDAPTERWVTPDSSSPSPQRAAATTILEDPLYGAERLERLGGGGFGEVWRVRYLGSEEAWKYIPIRTGSSERTGREAIHARRVDHPNVVRVLDVLKLQDHYVLRMDLVRGRDFYHTISQDGVLPYDEAITCGLQVASALSYAHQQGVVHLDLKPHNLIFSADRDKVLVTDFGISASIAQEFGGPPEAAGTPYFMAPEQFRSPPEVGPAVDIWSLGVTLYWALSLSYPFRFEGREPGQVIQEDEPIPLNEAAAHVPPGLCRIIHQMLEKDPARRPAGMDAVIKAFEAFRDSPGDRNARAGDRAFALCLFDEASRCYQAASKGKGEEAARSAALLDAVRKARPEHDLHVERLQTHLDQEDLASALQTLITARRRFSRSPVLRSLAERTEAAIVTRCASPRRTVERDLRRAQFVEARQYLDLLATLLILPAVRKLLKTDGEEALLDEAAVQRLRLSVEQREAMHRQLTGLVEDAVQAMDFARARDAMDELQSQFPLPENVERMRTFSAAAEHLAFLSAFPAGFLAKLSAGEVRASAERPLLLKEAESRCRELLKTFKPQVYPRFMEIQEKVLTLESITAKLFADTNPVVERIQKSHRRGDLTRVRKELESAGGTILHTDIFTKEVRDTVREIQKQFQSLTERAERLYREGRESLERRQFSKALTAFEEALRIGGGSLRDIEALIETANVAAERRRRLSENLHALEIAISSQAASLADVALVLEKSQELVKLQEDPKQPETISRAAAIVASAADSVTRSIVSAPPGKQLEPARSFAMALSRSRPEFIGQLARSGGDLAARVEALATAAIDAARARETSLAAGGEHIDARRDSIHELVDTLAGLGPVLLEAPVPAERHPAWQAASLVASLSATEGGSRPGSERDAWEVGDLLGQLAQLAPPTVADRIRAMHRRILESARYRRLALGAKQALRTAARLSLPLTVVLVVSVAACLAWSAWTVRRSARILDEALLEARKDPRWAGVETLAWGGGEEDAVALRVIGHDLPAFSGLDAEADPENRFWARCLAGARIVAWTAPDGTPVLGRGGIRRAVEEALLADAGTAAEDWVSSSMPVYPQLIREPGKGFLALSTRLYVAEKVLASGLAGEPTPEPSLALVEAKLARLRAAAEELGAVVDEASYLAARIHVSPPEARPLIAGAFWQKLSTARADAPSRGWRKLLDAETILALSRGLRERLEEKAPLGAELGAAYHLLHLIARIRERGGPLPIASDWLEAADPLYSVFSPLIR